MAKLLIPTRNRPTSTRNVLAYLAQFYPGTEVIVADGSCDGYGAAYAKTVDEFRDRLAIDYRVCDSGLSFFDRVLEVLKSLTDELTIMGADNYYPIMETLSEAEKFLLGNRGYMTAMGGVVHLVLENDNRLTARYGPARSMESPSELLRIRDFTQWRSSTTYAVARREHLIDRYERIKAMLLDGFYDYVVGAHDCMKGKLKGLPDIGFICSRSTAQSDRRADEQLFYLRRGSEIIALMEKLRDVLLAVAPVNRFNLEAPATHTVMRLITRRVADLAGAPAHLDPGFMQTRMFLQPEIQAQYKIFLNMFAEGTPDRDRYLHRLEFIARGMKADASSSDATNEPVTGEIE